MFKVAGILAAGQGSRLVKGFGSKAMYQINKRYLIDYGLSNLEYIGVEKVVVICRPDNYELIDFLNADRRFKELVIIRKTTRAAIESFITLIKIIGNDYHIIQSCDVIASNRDIKKFADYSYPRINNFGMIILTSNYVNDDKPIWVKTNRIGDVLDYGKKINPTGKVFANFRAVNKDIFSQISNFDISNFKHLTDLMTELVRAGIQIHSYNVEKAYDVDRIEDIP